MNKKLKIYQDSKELPFLNYKRIIQTGDFLYMVRNYEPGDVVKVDVKTLEEKFNEVVQDFVLSINSRSEEISDYGKIAISENEIRKLAMAVDIISTHQITNDTRVALGMDIDNSIIDELMSHIKIERSPDLEAQKQILINKIEKHNNDISIVQSRLSKEKTNNDEVDIDEQFFNVRLGLEIYVEEDKISLYQYGVMVKLLIKKVDEINKSRNNGR